MNNSRSERRNMDTPTRPAKALTPIEALAEAIEEIEFWSAWADEYFHSKYSLDETLARLRAVVIAAGE
jgi:DNA-binding response OmpR family regulator